MTEHLLSVDEICDYLGVKRDTVYKLISKHNLPAYRVGRLWKFKLSEVVEWVKNRAVNTSSEKKS